MNPSRRLPALLALLPLFAACSTPTLQTVAEDCARQDVVFFGELHGQAACHEQEQALLSALCATHKDVVLSMEMFERDVQEHVDAYLAGEMPEAEFRKKARTTSRWKYYRPLLEIARKEKLPFLAANAPRKLVRKVSQEGGSLDAVRGNKHVAREIRAPKDEYYRKFAGMMASHGVSEGGQMDRYYNAQCVWDETMAESIANYLAKAYVAGRRPLVFHVCGTMHSEGRRGTVQRLLRRNPGLRIRVIASSQVDPVYTNEGADYRLTVTKAKEFKLPPVASPHGVNPHAKDPHAKDPHAKNPGAENPHAKKAPAKDPHAKQADAEESQTGGRPGLGFMPAYDGDVEGCPVQMVMEGSAAAKAGIQKGDIIIKLAGEEIEDVRGYSDVLGGLKVGQKVKIVLMRDGKEVKVDAVLGESRR